MSWRSNALPRGMIIVQATHHPAGLAEIDRQTNALQSKIWAHLIPIVSTQPTPVNASLMTSLNEVFELKVSCQTEGHAFKDVSQFQQLVR